MRKHNRIAVKTTFEKPSMTKQSMMDECDVNQILAKYQKTGLITHVKQGGRYEDLPEETDYQAALNTVMEAEQSFSGLPSSVRAEFQNDPAKFLAFIENPENIDRMGELGLLNEPPQTNNNTTEPETDPDPDPE